jgi:RNA polymerase sigma-70 factor (ECF subfamily)
MRAVTPAHRRALVLHYLLDRSVADIAVETGAAQGTVKSWLSRGRAELAAALGQHLTQTTRGGVADVD